MDEKTQVRIYFFRFFSKSAMRGYFGFGLTPEQAYWATNEAHHAERGRSLPAGAKREGTMIRLPPGVTAYGVADDGRCVWDAPPLVLSDYQEIPWNDGGDARDSTGREWRTDV